MDQRYSNTIPCRWQVFLNKLLTVFVKIIKEHVGYAVFLQGSDPQKGELAPGAFLACPISLAMHHNKKGCRMGILFSLVPPQGLEFALTLGRGAALNAHWAFIHSRARSSPFTFRIMKKGCLLASFFHWYPLRDSNPGHPD